MVTASTMSSVPAASRALQEAVPAGCGEAPEPLSAGHDRLRDRPPPLLPVRGLQVPGGRVTFPQRGGYRGRGAGGWTDGTENENA